MRKRWAELENQRAEQVWKSPQDGEARQVLLLGEAKWGEVMGQGHLDRLVRARELLALKGYDMSATVLACFGGAGFTPELTAAAKRDKGIRLIDPEGVYHRVSA
jgi:hypothetical protein